MINTKTNEFLEELTKLVQKSNLPPVVVRLCLEVVCEQILGLEKKVMEQEKQQQEAKKQDSKE